MNAIIIGAGKTGAFLAQRLRGQHSVTVIECDLAQSEAIAAKMPDITVVLGDACEPAVLEYAGTAQADLVTALTGDDEDNLVASFLAKTEYNVPLVFARVNHPDNEWLFTAEWGVDAAISAASLAAALVEKEVDVGDMVTLLRLQAEHIQIEEVVVPDASPVVGKHLGEVSLPEGARVVAIVRGTRTKVPRSDTALAAADRLIIIGELGTAEQLHGAFGLRR